MIPKSMITLEGVYAAAPAIIFMETNADGTVNWAETRAVLNVYCNKKRGDEQYDDRFEINIKGENNIRTVASHVTKGKQLDRITCFVSVHKKGAIKVDKDGNPLKSNGQIVYEDVPRLHMQSIELGNDSETVEKAAGLANVRAMKAQGTIRPDLSDAELESIINGYNSGRRTKAKNRDFDLAESTRTGKWGHANLWSKAKGHWTAQPGAAPTGAPGISQEDLAEFYEFKRQQALKAAGNQTQAASASEASEAPAAEVEEPRTGPGSVWENDVPF